ncbi:YihY/virulence factor BrkB family protein [Hathewaya histolytica]|uniref:YihY family protein n=1 Tax=Hathewaya histolytica TaxID=1498 RepID=A0A4U9QYB4_HATHI|nr:YihY/virulence factor BrkB family protein [Hathewaya histolytica]VTQ83712.1 YihY family protein [Hathewaya histolytica]
MISFIKRLMKRYIEHDLYALASQLAYSLILSLFPFLIFLLTMVGYSSIDVGEVLRGLHSIIPETSYELISDTVVEVLKGGRSDLLSFSIIGTIWAASSGFRAVIKALNKAYDDEERRPYIKVVFMSIIAMISLVIILLFAFSFVVFGEMLGNALIGYLGLSSSFKLNWNILRYGTAIFFMIVIFSILYYVTPSRKVHWKDTLPGAIFSSTGWIVASEIFALYVGRFNSYSRIYGSLGAVIVLMVWLFISAMIILLGGEINAMLSDGKRDK